MKKILVISHDSSLSGAPVILGHLLKELKQRGSFSFDIISLKPGPMDQVFQAAGRLNPDFRSGRFFSGRLPWNQRQDYDLIYANTIASLEMAAVWKSKLNCKLILHVHELEYAFGSLLNSSQIQRMKEVTDHFIAVSSSVRNFLTDGLGISGSSVTLIHEAVPMPLPPVMPIQDESFFKFCSNHFIVGGSGSINWRKGTDLFLHTAGYTRDLKLPCKFVWVGQGMEPREQLKINYEIRKLALENTIFFTGEINNPLSCFQRFDLFFLSSREDPFPLVCLENGALGKPVIGFTGTGGIEEFVDHDPRCLIPYADAHEAALRIRWFMEHPEEASEIGNDLRKEVEGKYNIELSARKLTDCFLNVIKKTRPS